MRSTRSFRRDSAATGVTIVLIALVFGTPARAQTFTVTSVDPPDGSFGVPLHDTLTVRFSREVDIENDWNAVLRREPIAAFDSVRLTIGDINTLQTDVIFYEVFQAPNTDFVWLIVGMRDETGALLSPTVFSYSTAADRGTRSVTGQVAVDQLGKTATPPDRVLRALWKRMDDHVLRAAGHDATPSLQVADPAPRSQVNADRTSALETPDGVIVFLADRNIFDDPDWSMAAAAVTDPTGAYSIPLVRDGTYWPAAIKDLDTAGDPFEALGFYDPDSDGQPDPIVVSGGDLSGIDISLMSFLPETAAGGFAAASAFADQFAADQRLVWIFTPSVQDDGRSLEWYFNFHSPDSTLFTAVHAQGFFLSAITEPAIQRTADMLTVPDPYVDSNVALATADANGGDDFAARYPGFFTTHNMKGGNFFWETPRNTDDIYWEVTYAVRPFGQLETTDVFVDMATGAVIVPTNVATQRPGNEAGFRLSPVYPNPTRGMTRIEFEIDRAAQVDLRVFDLLGREVAVLVDGRQERGRHTATWDATGMPAGVYFYRLKGGRGTADRAMVLAR